MWCKVVSVLLVALQISTTGIAVNNTTPGLALDHKIYGTETRNTHRIIRRFTPKFAFPRPNLPTLPRPTFPFPVFNRELPKGEEGNVPKGKKRRPKPTEPSKPSNEHEDRTLLAAKKAILLKKAIIAKKAIILAKLKKKALLKKKKKKFKKKLKKKAILAYGIHKVSKLKGFTLKAPNLQVSFGKPPPGKLSGKGPPGNKEEEAGVYSGDDNDNENSSSGEENDSDDDDDDDDLDEDDDDDDNDPETQAVIISPSNYSQTAAANQQQLQQHQMPMVQQLTQQQQQPSASMMQQLQQQLLQQQQLQQQQQLNQQQQAQLLLAQQQQQQAVMNTPSSTLESTEIYTSKKKGKKKGKKKKGKSTPRPVNLGVKANLYKKFDKLTKKATDQISSFIQIDIDFFRSGQAGRAAIDDLVEPGRFVSRTARLPQNSHESEEEEEYDYVSEIEVPANFVPPWDIPIWRRFYPSRTESSDKAICGEEGGGSCELKPVFIIFNQGRL